MATNYSRLIKERVTDRTTFKELIERYYAAWNTGDPETAAPL
jgi:hypothetical protein